MSRPLRIEYPGAWYHVMNRGRRKEEIYTEPNNYRLFIETLQESAKLFNLKIAAYCLMPNHYHLTKTKRGIFNEPRGVAIYLTRIIRSDGLMDICKDYNLAKYSSASSIFETVRKKLQKDRKFRNRVNALSQKLTKSQSEA